MDVSQRWFHRLLHFSDNAGHVMGLIDGGYGDSPSIVYFIRLIGLTLGTMIAGSAGSGPQESHLEAPERPIRPICILSGRSSCFKNCSLVVNYLPRPVPHSQIRAQAISKACHNSSSLPTSGQRASNVNSLWLSLVGRISGSGGLICLEYMHNAASDPVLAKQGTTRRWYGPSSH